MILTIIAACEVGFWVLLVCGLAARYLLRRPRIGLACLVAIPLLDLVLLVAVGIDLHDGATATFAHMLAAIYLGFSVAYGHRMIRWLDVRFAYRFAAGPAPVKLYGAAYARNCWGDVGRTAIAAVVTAAALFLLTAIAADQSKVDALDGGYQLMILIFAIDLLWAISYTIWPRKAPTAPE